MGLNSPAEIAKNYVAIGKAKANMPFGKMKDNMWEYLVNEQSILKARIDHVTSLLKDKKYLSVMEIG